jgi:hypothetical protein
MSFPDAAPSEASGKIGPVTESNLGWAEQRHAMLARLAALGMRLAEEIVERAVDSPYHPEPRHEPVRAYANVARAVRFSLVLQARVEQQIIAMRNGEPAPALIADATSLCDASLGSVDAAPRATTDRDACDTEAAIEARDRSRESLIEGETYDDMLNRPIGECVEAICADLGVAFEAGLWSDDAGQPRDARRQGPQPPKPGDSKRNSPAPSRHVTSREPERVNLLE